MATLSNTRVNSRKEKLVEGLHAKWETSAPLTDFQSDQIVDLAALVSEALSPPSNDNDPHTSTSLDKNNSIGRDSIHSITELSSNNSGNTGANSYTMAQSERDSIDSLSGGGLGIARSRSIASSGEGDVVDTNLDPVVHTHHFYAWFANVESAMDVEQESMYRQHLMVMKSFLATCDEMIRDVDEGFECLDSLTQQYNFVSTKTESLHTACEELLTNRAELVRYADAVEERLQPFRTLERITLRLSAPNLSATSPVFVEVLQDIHKSLSYVKEHPDYVDSRTYLLKLQYQQNRALVLVKMHTVDLLKKATMEVKASLASKKDAFTAAYGLYGSKASSVLTLMREMHEGSGDYDEYTAVLYDCQTCYFSQRSLIVLPLIRTKLSDLNSSYQGDIPQWLRIAGSYMQRVCSSEYQLFHRFFPRATDGLHGFLESLTDIIYDEIRPHLIRITDLNALAELCDVVSTEVLADLWSNTDYTKLISFVTVMEQIQQDIQERMVYRTHEYIRREIQQFKPSAADLAYPDKLLPSQGDGKVTATGDQPITDQYSTWYPPMYMTLMCLSMLYRCVDRLIFEGISHECIKVCRDCLVQASDLISAEKSRLDGLLFLIKHLLTLREQIAPFDADFVYNQQSLDFNSTRAAALGFLNSTYANSSSLFTLGGDNPMMNLVREGVPTLREERFDSKKELDLRLRVACEELMGLMFVLLSRPFSTFTGQANAFMAQQVGANLKEQAWATPAAIKKLGADSVTNLRTEYAAITRTMTVYIRNSTTENVLIRPVKKRVLDAYADFEMLVAANYSDPDGLGLPNIGTITGYLNEQPRAPTPTNNPSTAPAAATGAAPMPSNVPAPSMNNLPPPPQTQAQPPNQIPTSALPPVLAHTHPNPPPSVQQQQQAQATIDPTGDTPTPIPTQSTDQSAGQDGTHMHKQLQAESTPQKPPGATVDV